MIKEIVSKCALYYRIAIYFTNNDRLEHWRPSNWTYKERTPHSVIVSYDLLISLSHPSAQLQRNNNHSFQGIFRGKVRRRHTSLMAPVSQTKICLELNCATKEKKSAVDERVAGRKVNIMGWRREHKINILYKHWTSSGLGRFPWNKWQNYDKFIGFSHWLFEFSTEKKNLLDRESFNCLERKLFLTKKISKKPRSRIRICIIFNIIFVNKLKFGNLLSLFKFPFAVGIAICWMRTAQR